MSHNELKIQEKKAANPAGETTKSETFFPARGHLRVEQEVTVIADLPGVTPEGLDLSLEDNILTIQGRRTLPAQTGRVILEEYESGHYLRRFTVAETIDTRTGSRPRSPTACCVCACPRSRRYSRRIEVKLG